jgi:hypothetical protein
LNVFSSKPIYQARSDSLGRSTFSHQFPKHGTQSQDQNQEAQSAANAILNRLDNGFEFHALENPYQQANDYKRQESIQFENSYQKK